MNETIEWTRRPFTNNEVVAIAIYNPPRQDLDPCLKFLSYVSFGEGARRGCSLTGTLTEFGWFIEHDLVPRFAGLFPPMRRGKIRNSAVGLAVASLDYALA